jgi:hypothetical protein
MTEDAARRIEVPVLTRVEGEGGLDLIIRDGRIAHLALRIFEPPRLFELFNAAIPTPPMVRRLIAYPGTLAQALQDFSGDPLRDASLPGCRRAKPLADFLGSGLAGLGKHRYIGVSRTGQEAPPFSAT